MESREEQVATVQAEVVRVPPRTAAMVVAQQVAPAALWAAGMAEMEPQVMQPEALVLRSVVAVVVAEEVLDSLELVRIVGMGAPVRQAQLS